ncbi:hypothetical protein F5B20DRAFT_577664 [Whalleya microplaca]|nr:hypothetical protein F5B20DRAFT_577664 [Whalleya microplaca]
MAPLSLPSPGHLQCLLFLLLSIIAIFPSLPQAQDTNSSTTTSASTSPSTTSLPPSPTLQNLPTASSSPYIYAGCYNETTTLPNTNGARALSGGISTADPGTQTVQTCLAFCAHNTSTTYAYAGLEYSRECYCARELSSLSVRLPDAECSTPCDGDAGTACGGALRLSVYNLTDSGGGGQKNGAAGRLCGGLGGWLGVVMGLGWVGVSVGL